MEKFDNSAYNLQLRITSEINELLKNRGVTVSQLKVEIYTKKTKSSFDNKEVIHLDGNISLKISAAMNKKNLYKFEDGDEEDEIIDEDYIGD